MTNCSNNYGPYHFPEKLIPLTILNALEGKPLPVYGGRRQCSRLAFCRRSCPSPGRGCSTSGRPGESYNDRRREKRTNIEVVRRICRLMDEMRAGQGSWIPSSA